MEKKNEKEKKKKGNKGIGKDVSDSPLSDQLLETCPPRHPPHATKPMSLLLSDEQGCERWQGTLPSSHRVPQKASARHHGEDCRHPPDRPCSPADSQAGVELCSAINPRQSWHLHPVPCRHGEVAWSQLPVLPHFLIPKLMIQPARQ